MDFGKSNGCLNIGLEKPRIVLFTTHESADEIINICTDDKFGEIVLIVYPANRRETSKVSDVISMASSYQIEVIEQPSLKEKLAVFEKRIIEKQANLGISWSYSQIIKPSTLALFRFGIWNMHGGKIPEYRGANVLQWAIANGEKELGVTWHLMNEFIDAGPILIQDVFQLNESENAIDGRNKIFRLGILLFRKLWRKFLSDGIFYYSPNLSSGHSYPSRKIIDGLITPSYSIKQVKDLLRAQCPPWPAPLIVLNNELRQVKGISSHSDSKEIITFACNDGLISLRLGATVNDEQLYEKAKILLQEGV